RHAVPQNQGGAARNEPGRDDALELTPGSHLFMRFLAKIQNGDSGCLGYMKINTGARWQTVTSEQHTTHLNHPQ
ncbi:MAG: hypothetical protein LBK99_04925, partial [Opitutaceae bacterium]|nr:hypothetical protein [Opitutaceae bacterium]